jgi:glutaredoxin 3
MAKVEIYTREFCGYCARALALLDQKGVDFEEIPAGMDPEKKREMMQRSGGRNTFPQIFVDGQHIGGSDDMMALEREGKLDGLLNA